MAFGIDDAIAAGLKVLNKFIPDPEFKAKAEAELGTSLLEWDKGQLEINKVEAAHSSIFVSGWRPFIGWTCGAAVAYQFVIVPWLTWISGMIAIVIPPAPSLDDMLWQLLFALLGMGGLRTFEKIKGVARA